jgi:DNA helicase-2/ATP-dependent DNA helicase PcrA
MQELNAQQREAVEYTEGALLVFAGPGSGKTTVTAHRVAHIINTSLALPSEILAVTFTTKAAREMRQRIQGLLPAGSGQPTVRTFHSFCFQLLQRDGGALALVRPGFTVKFHLLDESDQKLIIRNCCRELNYAKHDITSFDDIKDRISAAKTRNQNPDEFAAQAKNEKDKRFAAIYKAYEAALRRENALDYDDLIGETVRLLNSHAPTLRAWSQRLKYILVDEYQDTNENQYRLIRLLAKGHGNVCVVGDDDQSIYSWRGANFTKILKFESDFPNAKTVHLNQNYRSSGNIVAMNRAVIETNRYRKDKELWTAFPPGHKVSVYTAPSADAEAAFVASAAEEFLRDNPTAHVGILYRAHTLSRKIEEAMRRRQLPYDITGGLSFYEYEEVKDTLAYLRVATDDSDSISLLRIINKPIRGIGPETVGKLQQYARDHNLNLREALERAHKPPALVALRHLISSLSGEAASPLPDLLDAIEARIKYRSWIQNHRGDLLPDDIERKLTNLRELRSMAMESVARGESTTEFLDNIALIETPEPGNKKARAHLMTAHRAKGLEFPLVFVTGLEDGMFPSTRAEDMEEERRVFYVAGSRAMAKLILTWAKSRVYQGKWQQSEASRFLREVPGHLIDWVGLAGFVHEEWEDDDRDDREDGRGADLA